MLEDDIQYLGTRSVQRTTPPGAPRPFTEAPRPVTSIVLHVKPSGNQSAAGMVYSRSHCNCVDIGRRSSSTGVEKRHEPVEHARAMFRCPVISRRHAKITFSDCGHVYITDLKSHHGTHISKLGAVAPRTLKPETPTILGDGDVITFGKIVSKDGLPVSPVIVRVQLIYDNTLPQPLLPSSPGRSSAPHTPQRTFSSPTPAKNSSGRYGVDVTQSDLSDFSSHSGDSDIEELDGPPPPLVPTESANLSPLNFISSPFPSLPSVPSLLVPALEPRIPSPVYLTHVLPACHPYMSPFDDTSPRPGSPSPPYSPRSCSFELYSDGGREERPPDGYISPIELSTPSDISVSGDTDSRPIEERPLSRASSASRAADINEQASGSQDGHAVEIIDGRDDSVVDFEPTPLPALPRSVYDPASPAEAVETCHVEPEVLAQEVLHDDLRAECTEQPVHPSSPGPFPQVEESQVEEHERQPLPSESNDEVTTAQKVLDLDERFHDVYYLCLSLADQVETVTEVDVPDLQTTVEALQDQIDALSAVEDPPVAAQSVNLAEREANVETLNTTLDTLVNDMRSLCENAEKQIAADLEAVKRARASALANIASSQVRVRQSRLTPNTLPADTNQIPISLKRKRSDDDGGEDVSVFNHDKTTDGSRAGEMGVCATLPVVNTMDGMAARSCKRARTLMSTVVQTATAVTLGAIVTWSALAFS